VLRPGGTIRLALPDRRFTFDYLRRESTLADLATAWLLRPRRPLPAAVLDGSLNAVAITAEAAWSGAAWAEPLQRLVTWDEAITMARGVIEHDRYQDVHCWVFTPSSFALLMAEAASHELVRLACAVVHDTAAKDSEFIVVLRPCDDVNECVRSWQVAADGLRGTLAHTDPIAARRRLDEERDAFDAERGGLIAERDWLRHRLAAVEASTSWTLTAPLRALARALGRR
jgi:hypothetical protein